MLTTLPSKSTAHVRRTACAADARDAQLPKQRRSISDRVTHARPRVQRAQRRSCKARTVTGRAQHSMLRAPASAHPLGFFRRGWRARSCGTPGHSKRRGSDSLRSAQPCDASTAELQNWPSRLLCSSELSGLSTLNDFQPDTFDPGHKIFASRTCPDKRFSHLSEAKWCWERQGRINRGQQLAIESDGP